jgi:tetratricopeptide (TPR) repeat protein
MRVPRFVVLAAIAIVVSLALTRTASAQDPPSDPDMEAAERAMAACGAAASAGRHAQAISEAGSAERLFRTRLARRPDDVRALVGLARTIGQCRIPGASFEQVGELSAESVDLLERALEIEPGNWLGRYVLALNHYRAPSFLRRSGNAAREFDRLLAQQGDRNDVAEFARTFEYRGLLWSREGQRDSAVAVWQRGARLFPADEGLRARLSVSADAPATPARTMMDTVRVVVSRSAIASARATPSERVVGRSEVLMAAGGTADVMQAVQLKPGATRVNEGAELFTRGGDPAETAVIVDGGRVVSLARFEGLSGSLFGAIDPFVVRAARFSSGAFSVRHGDALSGLLEIETDGRPRELQWRTGLSLSQAGTTVRLPLGPRQGAWATLRGSHTGALLRTHGREEEFVGSPHSIEAMAAYVAQPAPGNELRVLGLTVRDASARVVDANGYTGAFSSRGGAQSVVVSAQRLATTRPVLVRGNVVTSERWTDWSFGILARERRERSTTVRGDIEYAPSDAVTVRAGLQGGRRARSDVGVAPASASLSPDAPSRQLAGDTSTFSGGGYAEGEWRVGIARLLAGVRTDRLPGEREATVDPRLAVSVQHAQWTVRVAGGQFHQGRWRAEPSLPETGMPAGVPREATHLVAGLERAGEHSFHIEGFVKKYGEYGHPTEGLPVVDGRARGVDLLVQRRSGQRISGWIGYSFLDAELSLADGRTVRSPFDVTHTATGNSTLRLGRGTTLGTTMRYGTGRPFTSIDSAREEDGHLLPEYGEPNRERLPAYARLDSRLTRYVPLGRSMLVGYVEALNLLDRRNVSGYVWDAAFQNRRASHPFYSERTMIVGFELQSR